jgi:hypothetical protein
MEIRLGKFAWRELHLDEKPENLDLVRAAFYIGYNLIRISRLTANDGNQPEKVDIIKTAKVLGMTNNDVVIYDEDVFP